MTVAGTRCLCPAGLYSPFAKKNIFNFLLGSSPYGSGKAGLTQPSLQVGDPGLATAFGTSEPDWATENTSQQLFPGPQRPALTSH